VHSKPSANCASTYESFPLAISMFFSRTKQWFALCGLSALGCCQEVARRHDVFDESPEPSFEYGRGSCCNRNPFSENDNGVNLLQLNQKQTCGPSPKLDGEDVKTLISDTEGLLIIAIPEMRCTDAILTASSMKAVDYKMVKYKGPFEYEKGESDVWDWLHCTYPKDRSNGAVMHSYVFVDGTFIGNGFDAADKIVSGELKLKKSSKTCEERFPNEANIVKQFMSKASTKVLLFGWLNCPCVGIAQSRLHEKSVCYESRTWADPSAKLMYYFQCREKDPESHSFIYFRTSSGSWNYEGNGFMFEEDEMTEAQLVSKIEDADADLTCKRANVKVNVFGSPLEECQVGDDVSGSWMDDGTCSETTGGIHQICIEELPEDFSSETHQEPWSAERKGMRHCVCVGAFSLYMTDAKKHAKGATDIMPHCKAIPETTLSLEYLDHWRDWNGFPAQLLVGVKELVGRCLAQAKTQEDKCGLKRRFQKLRSRPSAKELKDASELQALVKSFSSIDCPEEEDSSLLQLSRAACGPNAAFEAVRSRKCGQ